MPVVKIIFRLEFKKIIYSVTTCLENIKNNLIYNWNYPQLKKV